MVTTLLRLTLVQMLVVLAYMSFSPLLLSQVAAATAVVVMVTISILGR